jgi:hypothetical protein
MNNLTLCEGDAAQSRSQSLSLRFFGVLRKVHPFKAASATLFFSLFVMVSMAQGPGNALSFDGTLDYVKLVKLNNSDVEAGLNSSNITRKFDARNHYTIEVWIKWNGSSFAYVISQTTNFYLAVNANGTIVFNRGYPNVTNLVTTRAIESGRWYHLAITYNGSVKRIYINGKEEASQTDEYYGQGEYEYVLLGGLYDYTVYSSTQGYSPTGRFNGVMDELRIWNYARTQPEILSGMYGQINPVSSMYRYYRFNASSPTDTTADESIYSTRGVIRKTTNNDVAVPGNWVESYAMVVPRSLSVTGSTSSGFTASWAAPSTGTVSNYLLDVSTDPNFGSFVGDYSSKDVGSVTSYAINTADRTLTYYWRVRAQKTGLGDVGAYSDVQMIGPLSTWTGTSSSDWNTAGNWTPSGVPASGADIIIPNVVNDPVLDQPRTVSRLTVASGATPSLGTYTLTVTGTFINDGTIGGTGVVEMAGTVPQKLDGSGTIPGLTVSNLFGLTMTQSITLSALTVNSGALFQLDSYTAQLTGALTNNGFISGNGKVTLSGSSLQSIAGTGSISNLELNNSAGASISSGELAITGIYTPSAGVLSTNGRLILKSSVNGTASVAAGSTSGGYVSGSVTVERYIPATNGRKWQMLTAPLKGSSGNSIFQNWQNNGTSSYTKGVEIWGNGDWGDPVSNASGLLTGPSYGYSMRSYVNNAWVNVSNTKTSGTLFDDNGNMAYAIFVTGPYGRGNVSGQNFLATATTLSATGNLIMGDYNRNLGTLSAGQYVMVGNPYASPIDPRSISTANTSNISNTLWLWDARQQGSSNLGRYVSFDVSGGIYNNGGAGTGYPDNSVMIQSGQAFFVKAAAAGSASITFRESSKSSSNSNLAFGNNTEKPKELLALRLQREAEGEWQNIDGAVAFFEEGGNPAVDAMDGSKLMNTADNLFFRRGNSNLVFEHRARVSTVDTVFIRMNNTAKLPSRLIIDGSGFSDMWLEAFLIDDQGGKPVPLKLNGVNAYDFILDAGAGSNVDRFMIVLRKAEASAQLINIAADAQGLAAVDVKWSAPGDRFIKAYDVQRSTDGINYVSIGSVDAGPNNNGIYSYTDNSPAAGENNYRIHAVGINGGAVYSEIALVDLKGNGRKLTVFPNPAIETTRVFISDPAKRPFDARIVDATGRTVWSRSGIPAGTDRLEVSTSALKSGVYTLVIAMQDGSTMTTKIIRQ